jgi:uncharacterized membrane protein
LIVPLVVYGLIIAILAGAWSALTGGPAFDTDDGIGSGSIVAVIIGYILAFLVSTYVQMAYLSGCLDIADDKSVDIASFFKPRNFGPGIGAALLVGVLNAIGWALCVIPGIVIGFLAQFTIPFVIDRTLSPIDALKASITTAKNNVGSALLSYLVQVAVLLIGWLLFGVGLLVALPLAMLIQVYTYRYLSGGRVVVVAQ